ncbi:hypothetical protein EYF80_022391 [Liparis tanakae]|uniref:Uncharacterized protein n=1 Tax=Liparis tanakae TaxID=230148 RepID=A0A4Z2HQ97_9TELE|nr:hypothetical protein EYF80_022391 [Liparis tanakae]
MDYCGSRGIEETPALTSCLCLTCPLYSLLVFVAFSVEHNDEPFSDGRVTLDQPEDPAGPTHIGGVAPGLKE